MLGAEGLARVFETAAGHENVQDEAARLVSVVGERTLGVFRDNVCVLLARRR